MTYIAVIGTHHQFQNWAYDFMHKDKELGSSFQINDVVFFNPEDEQRLAGLRLDSFVILPYQPGEARRMSRIADVARQRCRGAHA